MCVYEFVTLEVHHTLDTKSLAYHMESSDAVFLHESTRQWPVSAQHVLPILIVRQFCLLVAVDCQA